MRGRYLHFAQKKYVQHSCQVCLAVLTKIRKKSLYNSSLQDKNPLVEILTLLSCPGMVVYSNMAAPTPIAAAIMCEGL
jgi:hypothetical protein